MRCTERSRGTGIRRGIGPGARSSCAEEWSMGWFAMRKTTKERRTASGLRVVSKESVGASGFWFDSEETPDGMRAVKRFSGELRRGVSGGTEEQRAELLEKSA